MNSTTIRKPGGLIESDKGSLWYIFDHFQPHECNRVHAMHNDEIGMTFLSSTNPSQYYIRCQTYVTLIAT